MVDDNLSGGSVIRTTLKPIALPIYVLNPHKYGQEKYNNKAYYEQDRHKFRVPFEYMKIPHSSPPRALAITEQHSGLITLEKVLFPNSSIDRAPFPDPN